MKQLACLLGVIQIPIVSLNLKDHNKQEGIQSC